MEDGGNKPGMFVTYKWTVTVDQDLPYYLHHLDVSLTGRVSGPAPTSTLTDERPTS